MQVEGMVGTGTSLGIGFASEALSSANVAAGD